MYITLRKASATNCCEMWIVVKGFSLPLPLIVMHVCKVRWFHWSSDSKFSLQYKSMNKYNYSTNLWTNLTAIQIHEALSRTNLTTISNTNPWTNLTTILTFATFAKMHFSDASQWSIKSVLSIKDSKQISKLSLFRSAWSFFPSSTNANTFILY